MKFMMLVKTVDNSGPPPKALLDEIAKLYREASGSAKMIDSGGLAPMSMTTRVRLSKGKVLVLDGPFAESKEVIGGYAQMAFDSKEEAVKSAVAFMELHKKFWPGWEGETEVRQIFGQEDFPPCKPA